MSNYIPKNLEFDQPGRNKLIKGITKISKAVKSTLGTRGKTVLIESPEHIGGMTITKDGVTVANSIFLDDPVENLAVQMLKDAARRTANSAGDGTTTAIVLDRKSTRLNSSHGYISYAVFCLTKKKKNRIAYEISHANTLTQS